MAEIPPEVQSAWQILENAQVQMRSQGGTEGSLRAGMPEFLKAIQGFRKGGDALKRQPSRPTVKRITNHPRRATRRVNNAVKSSAAANCVFDALFFGP